MRRSTGAYGGCDERVVRGRRRQRLRARVAELRWHVQGQGRIRGYGWRQSKGRALPFPAAEHAAGAVAERRELSQVSWEMSGRNRGSGGGGEDGGGGRGGRVHWRRQERIGMRESEDPVWTERRCVRRRRMCGTRTTRWRAARTSQRGRKSRAAARGLGMTVARARVDGDAALVRDSIRRLVDCSDQRG